MSDPLSPQDLTEAAFVAFIIAEGAGTANDVFGSIDAHSKSSPITEVSAATADEEIPFQGPYNFHVEVKVFATLGLEPGADPAAADSPIPLHKVRTGLTWAIFKQSKFGESTDLAAALSATTDDFTCHSVQDMGIAREFIEDSVCDTYSFLVKMSPSDID